MSEVKDELFLIIEGGLHSVEYMQQNGVFPKEVGLRTSVFRDRAPYLNANNDVLVVIKGLTDFTVKGIYSLMQDLESHKDDVKNIVVMSNIHLGEVPFSYYLYTGDLFYGQVVKIVKGKKVTSDEVLSSKKKVKASKKDVKTVDKKAVNSVMSRYKLYNQRDVHVMMYGTEDLELLHNVDDENLKGSIHHVDVFFNNEGVDRK